MSRAREFVGAWKTHTARQDRATMKRTLTMVEISFVIAVDDIRGEDLPTA